MIRGMFEFSNGWRKGERKEGGKILKCENAWIFELFLPERADNNTRNSRFASDIKLFRRFARRN